MHVLTSEEDLGSPSCVPSSSLFSWSFTRSCNAKVCGSDVWTLQEPATWVRRHQDSNWIKLVKLKLFWRFLRSFWPSRMFSVTYLQKVLSLFQAKAGMAHNPGCLDTCRLTPTIPSHECGSNWSKNLQLSKHEVWKKRDRPIKQFWNVADPLCGPNVWKHYLKNEKNCKLRCLKNCKHFRCHFTSGCSTLRDLERIARWRRQI